MGHPTIEANTCGRISYERGTSALHLNEATWIIDGSNELIVDFLFALVLFLDSTQPRPFKNPKQIFFFGSNKRMTCKSNSNAKPNPGQHHSSFHLLLHSNAGLVFLLDHNNWELDPFSKTWIKILKTLTFFETGVVSNQGVSPFFRRGGVGREGLKKSI